MKKAVVLFVLCVAISVALGFLDVSLSDAFLYQNQVTRVHYRETFRDSFLLGIVSGLFSALFLRAWKTGTVLRLWAFLLILFILAIKIQLVWLSSQFFDKDSLLATTGLIAIVFALFWVSTKIPDRVLGSIGVILLLLVVLLRRQEQHHGGAHPNIVLIVMDTVRADHLSCYGYPLKTTPNLDALAAKGVQYDLAITPSPWTAPSHAAIFTGLFPAQNQVHEKNIRLDPKIPTLASLLSQDGYQTVGFTNNVYVRRRLGLANGFEDFEELWGRNEISSLLLFEEWVRRKRHPREDAGARDTFEKVQDWFAYDYQAAKGPFFLFVNYMEAHAPYQPVPGYKQKFVPQADRADADRVNQDPEAFLSGAVRMSDRDFLLLSQLYDGELGYLDDQIGKLLAFLSQQTNAKNTMYVVLSDHGENFGDHGLMSHEMSVHDTLIHVPMILYYPSVFSGGKKVECQVMTIDLFPTLLNIAGVQKKPVVPGMDLTEEREHRFAFAEYNTVRAVERLTRRFPGLHNPFLTTVRDLIAVRMPGFKLSADGDRQQYFALPDEDHPLRETDLSPAVRSELDRAFQTWKKQMGASRKESKERMTPEEQEELRSLNYIN